MGSAFVARRVGIQHANNTTTISKTAVNTNVVASLALTPNSKLLINRVNPNATVNPMTRPMAVNFIPCHRINLRMSLFCAPSARRTQISRIRCDTEYAMIP